MLSIHIYGKFALGAESHYEFCCSFPHNAHTLHGGLNFIVFLCHLLRSPDLDLVTTLSYNSETEGVPNNQNT